jgi:hypothetical protein
VDGDGEQVREHAGQSLRAGDLGRTGDAEIPRAQLREGLEHVEVVALRQQGEEVLGIGGRGRRLVASSASAAKWGKRSRSIAPDSSSNELSGSASNTTTTTVTSFRGAAASPPLRCGTSREDTGDASRKNSGNATSARLATVTRRRTRAARAYAAAKAIPSSAASAAAGAAAAARRARTGRATAATSRATIAP